MASDGVYIPSAISCCSAALAYTYFIYGFFAEIQDSFAGSFRSQNTHYMIFEMFEQSDAWKMAVAIQGSLAEIQGSFSEIQGSLVGFFRV